MIQLLDFMHTKGLRGPPRGQEVENKDAPGLLKSREKGGISRFAQFKLGIGLSCIKEDLKVIQKH